MGVAGDPENGARDAVERPRSGLLGSVSRLGRRFVNAIALAASSYGRSLCPQLAASIAYHVLFSLLPFTIFLVSILGLVMQNDSLREQVVSWLIGVLPLSESAGTKLDEAVAGLAAPTSAAGVVALLGFFWSASGMMGAIRKGLDLTWGVPDRRPYGRAKLVDLALVLGAGGLMLVAFGLTFVSRTITALSAKAAEVLEPFGSVVAAAGGLTEFLIPLVVVFPTFLLLYHLVPALRPRPRLVDCWAGALLAAAGFEAAITGFSIYVAHFANYNLVYGSLGAVIGFLFLVYLGASVFLFGAQVAAAWPRADLRRPKTSERQSLGQRLVGLVRGLFVREVPESERTERESRPPE